MWTRPQPIATVPPNEVPLPDAPLVRVISQVRFPPILAIRNPDVVAVFQELLRDTYPNMSKERTQGVNLNTGRTPSVTEDFIWRLASEGQQPPWRVSLGVDFVALETTAYASRRDFLSRLDTVLGSLSRAFHPTDINRLGLRYIDRITDSAVERIGRLIHPKALGILHPTDDALLSLGAAAVHVLTEARFVAMEGHIQARWGKIPHNTTYDPIALEPIETPSWVLDLDMFTLSPEPFIQEALMNKTENFAEQIYAVFRKMVTDES